MDYTNVGASLRIMGECFDVQRITDTLGVTPSQTWNKGDPIRNTGKKRKYTAWVYDTKRMETLSLDALIKQIMEIFSPQVDNIVALKKQFELVISLDFVIIIENEEPPAIYFEPDFINFAAEIGARFDIDTYVN